MVVALRYVNKHEYVIERFLGIVHVTNTTAQTLKETIESLKIPHPLDKIPESAPDRVYSPIFAEIVPEQSRTCIYALDRSFESVLSSFAPPIVGLLAQHVYGYKPVPQGSKDTATDRGNAESLAKALYTSIGIPMALCCYIYTFLYSTYPRDRERARMEALIESEMQQINLDTSPARGQYSDVRYSESKELYADGRAVVEMDDFDDSDEKLLLYCQLTFSNLGE